MAQIFVGKRTLVTDVYPLKSQKQFVNTLEDNIRFRGAMTKLISDNAKVEISNKVKDIIRMYHSSSWNSEPCHQNQNPAEGRYCTLKSWTNTIMNRSGAPADCWLLCMIHASYILNHLSCEALAGNVPLGMLYGVSPDISILLLYTFYQPVFYATHNQSYPSASEERAARWVGFGEHVGDALTHKLLDDDTKKILYRSAVRPSDSAHPNKHLVSDGGESSQTPKPIVFVRSRQDDSQSATKPMAEYNPDGLIGRTFLLPKNEQGEKLRATIKRKVIETSKLLDNQHDKAIDKINFHLDVGQGRAKAMSYVQILDHLDHQEQQDDLYKVRAITGYQGPLSPQDENYKGSKYNVMVEWETGEITDEPLSLIAADDPVTYADQKQLTRAINQSKIRQVRRSAVYQFGFLIPKDYKQALQLDEQNGNSKWYDATKLEMDQINEY